MMHDPNQTRATTRWQWSVRSLLAITTIVAVWLGAWTFHYSAGLVFTAVLFPACLLFILAVAVKEKAQKVKLWAFCLLILAGITIPPLLVLLLREQWNAEILPDLALASFLGLVVSTSYGIYLLLLESILEVLFGRTGRQDGEA